MHLAPPGLGRWAPIMEEESEDEADFPVAGAPLYNLAAVSPKIAKKKKPRFVRPKRSQSFEVAEE